jgi:hypothetical protein
MRYTRGQIISPFMTSMWIASARGRKIAEALGGLNEPFSRL